MNVASLPIPQILIASSDSATAQSLASMLDEWHYPFRVVSDGATALRILTQDPPPAIAIIDTALDGLDGIHLIQVARQRYEQRQTWLMLIGEQASPGGIRSAAEAGADDFLLKPLDQMEFRVRLRVAERVQGLMVKLVQEGEAAKFHATHDPLTGLLNRDSLLKHLFQETDRVQRMKTPLAYMLVDIDSFSLVNQHYGYEFGDRLLQDLGTRLKRHLRSYDLVGRYGEDEFLLALPGCSAQNLAQMAERMRRCVLDKPFEIDGKRITVTASIGAAHSRGRSPLVVMREAERSLAQAKMDGRNCIRDGNKDPNEASSEAELLIMRMPDLDMTKAN